METIDIEKEVQARVDFKLNELLGAMKQAAARNWHIAFQSTSLKHSHYWEAFEEMVKMLDKERRIPTPTDQMYLQRKHDAKNEAVEKIKELIIPRFEHPANERHIIRTIVSAVEKAQNY